MSSLSNDAIAQVHGWELAPSQGRYRNQYESLNSTLNEILPGANNLAIWNDGQAEAAVCLQKNECCWGSWRQQKAAILQFFTTRFEPQGFELSALTTELSFHDRDPQASQHVTHDSSSSQSVYILDRPAPEVVVPRGLQQYEEENGWRYSSFLKGEGQRYTTAIWYWQSGVGSRRLGDLHGAVLIGHHDEPFYICCKLQGRLVNATGVWTIGRRILKFISRTAVKVQSFRIERASDQKSIDLEDSVADLQHKVEALIHGTQTATESKHLDSDTQLRLVESLDLQQLQSFTDIASSCYSIEHELKQEEVSSIDSLVQEKYAIAIICAMPVELMAIRLVFDRSHKEPAIDSADTNHYAFGTISGHNVVAACLPSGLYGNSSATDVVSQLRRSFPQVELCILVGIGGGVPSSYHDIRLGDVVVSDPGIIKYDFEKVMENGIFQQIGTLQPAPRRLLTSISNLSSNPDICVDPLRPYLDCIATRMPEYRYPGSEKDILFEARYQHVLRDNDGGACLQCSGPSISRPARSSTQPEIHYGIIASGDKVMKNAQVRDKIGNKHNALCIEMEGAGIASVLPCLSICGISDYSDSHKNDGWRNYACASAAAYTKLLLTHTRQFQSTRGTIRSMPVFGFDPNTRNHHRSRQKNLGISIKSRAPNKMSRYTASTDRAQIEGQLSATTWSCAFAHDMLEGRLTLRHISPWLVNQVDKGTGPFIRECITSSMTILPLAQRQNFAAYSPIYICLYQPSAKSS